MNIEQPGSYFLELRNHFWGYNILKFFDADPGSGTDKIRIRGWKKFGSGIRESKVTATSRADYS